MTLDPERLEEHEPEPEADAPADALAIVGMAGRFPGATDIAAYWANLRDGVEALRRFSDRELLAAGVDPRLLALPNYVKAGFPLDGVEDFDAAFFGVPPREAALMDPQQRLFLECAWEALEDAGCDPRRFPGPIGVMAGVGANDYLINLLSNPETAAEMASFGAAINNEKDFMAVRVAYKLDLRGASFTVQTACSSSLVAVHLACQSLLNGETDLMLAGGVSLRLPTANGYLHQEGMIFSPDGHCRAFDAQAEGVAAGSGLGAVALKRLDDALRDGDRVYAVILGSALNNDGGAKAGFTAPGVEGQAAVIAEALSVADVDPASISYIEAHGTGTRLGDPIEIAALTKAYRERTDQRGYCAIGSAKTNIGHLDAAAGVAGLIKAALTLRCRQIPPSLHFQRPNPQIDFDSSPFFVNAALRDWEAGDGPRRAGLSSFGIGGANVHLILEEAPSPPPTDPPARPASLLVLSARTPEALERARQALADRLTAEPNLPLADVAYTLQTGRAAFEHRLTLICRDGAEAAAALANADQPRLLRGAPGDQSRAVAFMFPGQGSQYAGMARELYRDEPVFRENLDECLRLAAPHLDADLRPLLLTAKPTESDETALAQTALAQPAVFAVSYALARLWQSWGVRPEAFIGHSVGEYAAACMAGTLSLEDALKLVAARGRLMQGLPAGAMLAVSLDEATLAPELGDDLSLAAVNGPGRCVVSGPSAAIAALAEKLRERGVAVRELRTSHAFHSAMMDPILDRFRELAAAVPLQPPRTPFISNLSGDWITAEQATAPDYWVRHLRGTVRFHDGLTRLLQEPGRVLAEAGPGRALAGFALRCPAKRPGHAMFAGLPRPGDRDAPALDALALFWAAGAEVDWEAFYAGERRRKVGLPAYPFERQRFWIERRPFRIAPLEPETAARDIRDWFYKPVWRAAPLTAPAPEAGTLLIFADADGVGETVAASARQRGAAAIVVRPGGRFERLAEDVFALRPGQAEDLKALCDALDRGRLLPRRVLVAWGLTGARDAPLRQRLDDALDRGFYTILNLARALAPRLGSDGCRLIHAAEGFASASGPPAAPEQAAALGPLLTLPQERPEFRCRAVNLAPGPAAAEILLAELDAADAEPIVAYRDGDRLALDYEPAPLPPAEGSPLPERAALLITGGLGNVGLALAERLARDGAALRLALLGRTAFPEPAAWDGWLAAHGNDDAISAKILRLRALEAAGADILILHGDVADPDQLRAALNRIDAEFGALDGVIHAAGLVGQAAMQPFQSLDRDAAEAQFAAKIRGGAALAEALRGRDLHFVQLASSLASALGGLGFAAYAAGNAFLDALAETESGADAPWLAVNWDGWLFDERATDPAAATAMTGAEGAEAFARLLAAGVRGRALVSKQELAPRLDRWVRRAPPAPEPEAAVDRHARPALAEAYAEPDTPLASQVAEILADLLGIDRVGANDDFFALGGDSLLATQVFSRIRDAFRIDLPVAALFDAPTPARLAARIAEAGDRAAAEIPASGDSQPESAAPPAIRPAPRQEGMPLSFAQQRLWFLDQLERGAAAAYIIPAALRMDGPLAAAALDRALQAMTARHETLRTAFGKRDGEAVQLIAETVALPLPLIDLRGLPPAQREAEVRRLTGEALSRPFDLGRAPLLRISLLQIEPEAHLLLAAMHHIISDAWSIGVFIRETAMFYERFALGTGDAPAPLPIQYADFAVWQRRWQEDGGMDRQLAFWKERLAGAPELLTLPTDRPRPPVQTFRGRTYNVMLDRDLALRLQTLTREAGATLFMTLLAAYNALLSRYSRQRDIVVGAPIANRNRGEIESLIGFFVNTLALRTDLNGDPSFAQLLDRVRAAALDAFANQDTPFEKLVEVLKPQRDLSHAPIYQTVFVLQNAPMEALALSGLSMAPVEAESEVAKFDLSLTAVETDDGLATSWEYNTDLFDDAFPRRLAAQYETFLRAAAAAPQTPLSRLPLMSEAERRRLLCDWNETDRDFGGAPLFHQAFAAQAAAAPHRPAVVWSGPAGQTTVMSYGSLERRAQGLAARLRACGVGPETLAAVCLDRSPELVAAVLAVLMAGGGYLPLDPDYPRDRLDHMIGDARPTALLTRGALIGRFSAPACPVLTLEDEATAAPTATAAAAPVDPDHLAYTLYTSGSTGRPKGAQLAHRGLNNLWRAQAEAFAVNAEDRVLQFASFSFDASIEEIWLPLITGARLILRTDEMLANFHVFLNHVAELAPTVLSFPTEYWRQLTDHLAASPEDRVAPSVRMALLGGERANPDTVIKWLRTVGHRVALWNDYGPTETAVNATTFDLATLDPEKPLRESPIGRAWGACRAYALDRFLEPVPPGVPGELFIGGPQLSRGYHDRPAQTAVAFLPNPFAEGERLYKTGDRVRWLASGQLEFLGRFDFQVKLRGFRIEPAEIERALERHAAVKIAAVKLCDFGADDQRLIAFIELLQGKDMLEPGAWRSFLHDSLPDYMIPAAVIALDAMPMTASGKADRRALPDPDPEQLDQSAGVHVEPRDDFERKLAELWAEVLRRDRVSATGHFFDLGGHSLLATRLTYKIWEAFGVEMPLKILFEHPTLEEQAQWLSLAAPVEADEEDLDEEFI